MSAFTAFIDVAGGVSTSNRVATQQPAVAVEIFDQPPAASTSVTHVPAGMTWTIGAVGVPVERQFAAAAPIHRSAPLERESAGAVGEDVSGPDRTEMVAITTMAKMPRPQPVPLAAAADSGGLLEGAAEREVEKEIPVPGKPRVVRPPRGPMLYVAPRPPMLALTPLPLRLSRRPGKIRTDFLNRKPIAVPPIQNGTSAADIDPPGPWRRRRPCRDCGTRRQASRGHRGFRPLGRFVGGSEAAAGISTRSVNATPNRVAKRPIVSILAATVARSISLTKARSNPASAASRSWDRPRSARSFLMFHPNTERASMLAATVWTVIKPRAIAYNKPFGLEDGMLRAWRFLGTMTASIAAVASGTGAAAPDRGHPMTEVSQAAAAGVGSQQATTVRGSGVGSDTALASRPLNRSDVSSFDVGGLKLGMSANEVERIARSRRLRTGMRDSLQSFADAPDGDRMPSFETLASNIAADRLNQTRPRPQRILAHVLLKHEDGSRYDVRFAATESGPALKSVMYTTPMNGNSAQAYLAALKERYGPPSRSGLGGSGFNANWCARVDPTCETSPHLHVVSDGAEVNMFLDAGYLQRTALTRRIEARGAALAAASARKPVF